MAKSSSSIKTKSFWKTIDCCCCPARMCICHISKRHSFSGPRRPLAAVLCRLPGLPLYSISFIRFTFDTS
jgi:hypothetical protein